MEDREVWVRVAVYADDVDLSSLVATFEGATPPATVAHLHGLRVLTRLAPRDPPDDEVLEVEAHLYVHEAGDDAADLGRFVLGVVEAATGARVGDVAVLGVGPAVIAHAERGEG
ncbi:MAG TPA: hypothetical protein VM388_10895 [Acidimicrobiales bacterium]|nr:hypothetical protein [Acidimicrobiales bacterium]